MKESTIWADARLAGLGRIREGTDWKCQFDVRRFMSDIRSLGLGGQKALATSSIKAFLFALKDQCCQGVQRSSASTTPLALAFLDGA